jgi:hypothetical protein
MRLVSRLRKLRSSSAGFPRLSRGFGYGQLIVHGARSSVRASVFGKFAGVSVSPSSFPPNKSFKPTPCRGGSHVLCATLARVRRPATGRLNSGVSARTQNQSRSLFDTITMLCSVAYLLIGTCLINWEPSLQTRQAFELLPAVLALLIIVIGTGALLWNKDSLSRWAIML